MPSRAALVAALVFATTSALAQAPVAPSSSPPLKWGPFIDFDGTAGTERNIGEGDLFVPLWQDSASMLFADIRTRFDDRSGHEGNFGMGVRHMLSSGWNLGLYGYYDRRHTALGSGFGQGTFGAEALSLDWDVRANLYRPIGPQIKNLDISDASTASLSGTSVLVTTASSEAQEVEQPGFDAEIGWRVPIFAPESTTQLRVYAGGYRFAAAGVRTTAGPRGRLDLTIGQVPHLWQGARLDLGAELQHDGPRGTQAFALISLRVPLQIFHSAPAAALTPMERRMEDPIVRDVDVVTETRSVTTSVVTESATETAGGSAITVLSSSSTTGAALPGAVSTAGANSTVILSGSFTTSGTVTLQSGQTVMGAGTVTVKTPSGRTATLMTSGATITGNLGGTNYTIAMASKSTLTGMTINNINNAASSNALAVSANGVSGATISNNTLNATETGNSSTAHGVDVISGASNVTVSNNTITANASGAAYAIGVQVNGASATVSGNSLSASGGITENDTVNLSSANILSGSSGNKAVAGSCHVATAGTGGTVTFTNASACGP